MRVDTQHALSRRGALVRLGVGGVAAGLALRGLAAGAQEATPDEATPQDTLTGLPPGLAEWVAGWEALDVDRIVTAYTEDAVHEDVPLGETFTGRAAIRSHFAPLSTEFTIVSSRVMNVFVSGTQGAAEWAFSGTYTGQVPGYPPGGGELITVRGSSVFELAGDAIAREAEYYDALGILVQLGVIPAPGSTGTPVGATPAT